MPVFHYGHVKIHTFHDNLKTTLLCQNTYIKKLKHFTSDKSNFILFEPNFGWHRGTHVQTGERIALQIILKPNGDK